MGRSKKLEETKKEESSAFRRRFEYPILGALIVGAFLLRVLTQLDEIFVNGAVWFRGMDSWYHMRLVDNMMANFPRLLNWDMYAQFPEGSSTAYKPLQAIILTLLGQMGNYEVIAAYLPPVLGALTLIPLYFICKSLFSPKVGILACVFASILPGEFLHRTLLGFTDHHALEVFLMTSTVAFLIYAYKSGRWVYIIGGGISLGLYCLNWAGVAFFLLMLGVWIAIEALRRYTKGEDLFFLVKIASIPMAIAFLLSFWVLEKHTLAVLLALVSAPLGLWLLTKYISKKPRSVALGIGATFVVVMLIGPLNRLVREAFQAFWGGPTYIQEAAPLLTDIPTLFALFGLVLPIAFLGLVLVPKKRVNWLFLIWAVILIIALLGQRRWGYYSTIPVSILASYSVFHISTWVRKEARVAVVIVLCLFLIMPSVTNITRLIGVPNHIDGTWYNTLTWMRDNTPDPYEDEHAYYSLNPGEANYGILSWWDYGHWIIRIGERVPLTSPTQGGGIPSEFYTATTVEEAEEVIGDLNIRYVIIDRTLLEGKWYAVVMRAHAGDLKVQDSMLWKLWNEQVEGYTEVYNAGGIKVYERE